MQSRYDNKENEANRSGVKKKEKDEEDKGKTFKRKCKFDVMEMEIKLSGKRCQVSLLRTRGLS